MTRTELPDNFYEQIKRCLHRRVGRELRLACRVLDLGCGSCDLAGYLANTYCQRVTGVDISSNGFPQRQGRARQGRVRCIEKDAAHLDFIDDASVDAVVMIWALHEMTHPEEILGEVRRVLQPGGEVLVVEFPRDSLAQRLWDEDYFRPEELKQLLILAGLCDVRIRLIEQQQLMWAKGFRPPEAGRAGAKPFRKRKRSNSQKA